MQEEGLKKRVLAGFFPDVSPAFQVYTSVLIFPSWEELLERILRPMKFFLKWNSPYAQSILIPGITEVHYGLTKNCWLMNVLIEYPAFHMVT